MFRVNRLVLWGLMTKVLATVGLLFLFVTFSPFVSWYATWLARPWQSPEGDVLVVLSASGPNHEVMDPSTYWRCFMALLYDREHPFRQIIVSGKDSAQGMRAFLVFNGVSADRILVEDQAGNTHENAEFVARKLAGGSARVVLLTSDYHMFRARRCFARAGVSIVASSVPDVIKRAGQFSARSMLFESELEETTGIIYYWYRGWI